MVRKSPVAQRVENYSAETPPELVYLAAEGMAQNQREKWTQTGE